MNKLAATYKINNNQKTKQNKNKKNNCHVQHGTDDTYITPYIVIICRRAVETKGSSGLLQYANLTTPFTVS